MPGVEKEQDKYACPGCDYLEQRRVELRERLAGRERELREARKALKPFVQALDAGIERLPIHSRKTELVCRHCGGPSTTGSARDFVHDENCIIIKGRNALADNDEGEPCEHCGADHNPLTCPEHR